MQDTYQDIRVEEITELDYAKLPQPERIILEERIHQIAGERIFLCLVGINNLNSENRDLITYILTNWQVVVITRSKTNSRIESVRFSYHPKIKPDSESGCEFISLGIKSEIGESINWLHLSFGKNDILRDRFLFALAEQASQKLLRHPNPGSQFNIDFSKKHILINKVFFLDQSNPLKDVYVPAQLELFGYSYQIRALIPNPGNFLIDIKQGSYPSGQTLEYSIVEKSGTDLILEMANNERIKIPNEFWGEIENHLDVTNSVFKQMSEERNKIQKELEQENNRIAEERIRDEKEIIQANLLTQEFENELLPKLIADTELKEMAINFIEGQHFGIFTNPLNIIAIERYLREKVLLWMREVRIENKIFMEGRIPKDQINFNGFLLTSKNEKEILKGVTENIRHDGITRPYLESGMPLFSKVIQKRYNLPFELKTQYLAYIYLNKIALTYFSNLWEKEYLNDFRDLLDLDLASAIQRYISIPSILHKDEQTIGIYVYYLMDHFKFKEVDNYLICQNRFVEKLIPALELIKEQQEFQHFFNKISKTKQGQIIGKTIFSIDDIDLMTGQEFEQCIASIFNKMGYETKITKATGDQGIDVIASKNAIQLGIQAKCYSGTVGNSAIQEAVAGRNLYRLDKVMVITNNYFTDSAKQLAAANQVVLWDRTILKEKLESLI